MTFCIKYSVTFSPASYVDLQSNTAKMKFFLIAVCATVAFAAPEVTWSEDGQYKLVEKEPLEMRIVEKEPLEVKLVEKEPVEVKYIEKEPLKIEYIEKEPLVKFIEAEPKKLKVVEEPIEVKYVKPLRLGYVPVSYELPMAYRRLDYQPFYYRYEQLSK